MNAFPGSLFRLLFLVLLPFTGTAAEPATLRSGAAALSIQPGQPARVVLNDRPGSPPIAGEIPAPLRLGVLDLAGHTRWLEGAYASVKLDGAVLRCAGELRTADGSVFGFADSYAPGPAQNSFVFGREVAVRAAAPNDAGFLTRLGLRWTAPGPALAECEGFMPGVWYLGNRNVPAHALAADLAAERIWVREDRLPLPLIMLRRPSDGAALTLIHLRPDGGSCPEDEEFGATVVDARLQFAALGVTSPAQPELSLVYPGTEADRTYLRARRRIKTGDGVAERFHPVQPGVRHAYQAMFVLARQPAYAPALKQAWRAAFVQARPPLASGVNLSGVYEASIRLLGSVEKDYNGVPGLPFRLPLPGGKLVENGAEVSYQMGFVGQQLPVAYHLLRYGFARQRDDLVRKGTAIMDFWSAQSPLPDGMPRTWYDPFPQPHWRDYHTFLRVASDGMNGALQAWDFMRQRHIDKPVWLKFCRGYGDWLVARQNPDGSWFREYGFDGKPTSDGKQNTSHPIRFLVDLAAATGERRYAEAAVRAGEYCLKTVHADFAYVGGTADNPNVIDKEAGFMALDAFLALRDLTGDARWTAAAAQAADFTETWLYNWSVPPLPGAAPHDVPPGKLTSGAFSLIATGHSAADLFLAGAPFFYYRLYLYTNDVHYLDIARLLFDNPRQFVDVDGSLGYGRPGLCPEALSLATPRGHGVGAWLPWLTISMIEPMARLEETFGSMNLDALTAANRLDDQRARNERLARVRSAVWQAKR